LDIFFVLNAELETISKGLALWLPRGHGFPGPELTLSDSPKCFEYNRNTKKGDKKPPIWVFF
jgi:hypothetical protein